MQSPTPSHDRPLPGPNPPDPFGLKAMEWSGWASPIGLGLFVLCVAGALDLVGLFLRLIAHR